MSEYHLMHIPACPRCTCLMYPSVGCAWPYVFTVWGCHCEMFVIVGHNDDEPTEEFILAFSFLLAGGYLKVDGGR